MSTKREIRGFWWPATRPEPHWFGVLTLESEHSPTLEVVVEATNMFDDMKPAGGVIHGKDEGGKPITLLFVTESGHRSSVAVHSRTFHAGYALLGIAVDKVSDFVVNDLCLRCQQLYGWLGISGFKRATAASSEGVTFQYRQPEELVFAVSDEMEIRVRTSWSSHDSFQRQRVEEEAVIAFRSPSGFSLERCLDLVGAMRYLLNFASLKPVYPIRMVALKNGYGQHWEGRCLRHDIEVWNAALRGAETEPPLPDRWLFRFEDVRGKFVTFMREWLGYVERFEEALGCYAATVYHQLPASLEHLCIAQALEAYRGVKSQSHEKVTFRAKIGDLVTLHGPALKGLVDNSSAFADEVLASRNYYTHHDPRLLKRGKVAKGEDLIRLNAKLGILFQMCVLSDLGVSPDRFLQLRRQIPTEIVMFP